uniref:Uncharacterized protein n=1 Tax=Rhizophora mucronata TaxID=61149 RepID=A0A2P2Q1I3_RHIMU
MDKKNTYGHQRITHLYSVCQQTLGQPNFQRKELEMGHLCCTFFD